MGAPATLPLCQGGIFLSNFRPIPFSVATFQRFVKILAFKMKRRDVDDVNDVNDADNFEVDNKKWIMLFSSQIRANQCIDFENWYI